MKTQATQVYFPRALHFQIKQAAQKDGCSITKWLEDAAEKKLEKDEDRFDWNSLPKIREKLSPLAPQDMDKLIYKL